MGILFTNNWKNIADKLRSTFRTEFKGALPVYINDENVSTGGQYLQLDLASTSLSQKMLGCELREYTVNISYIFQSPNVKKSSLDHILRYTSRIEQLMQNNISLSLTDSTTAVNCRIESTDLQEGEDNSYLVSFDWKCQHLSGLSEVIDTTPVTFYNTYSLNFDGSNDYVDTGFQPDFIHTNATMSYWCKMADFSANQVTGCHNSKRFYLGFSTENAFFGTADVYKNSTDLSSYISVDTWMHLCLVMEDGTATFYLDGIARDTNSYTQASATNPDTDFFIGAASISSSSESFMEGNIDEVAIWNTALDADAITAIYNSGTPISLSADSGDYDNSDNLQGYWRMGDGTLDEYPLIADQVNPTLGDDLAVWSGETASVGAYSGIESNTTVNLTSGKLYKISFTVSSYTSGSFRFRQPSGADAGVTGSGNGDYTKYIVATNVNELNCDAFNLGFVGVISDYIVKEVQGNAGLMTNMASGDIEEDTP